MERRGREREEESVRLRDPPISIRVGWVPRCVFLTNDYSPLHQIQSEPRTFSASWRPRAPFSRHPATPIRTPRFRYAWALVSVFCGTFARRLQHSLSVLEMRWAAGLLAFVALAAVFGTSNGFGIANSRSHRRAGRVSTRMSSEPGSPDPNAPRFLSSDAGPAPAGKSRCQRIQFKLNGPVVEMEVFGVQGDECLKLTESIEEALGTVIYREDKPERWQKVEVEDSNTIFESKYSEW